MTTVVKFVSILLVVLQIYQTYCFRQKLYSSKLNSFALSERTLTNRGRKLPPKLPDLSQKSFPPVPDEVDGYNYDLVVFGSGPGGEAVAVQSAKLGAKVALIEKKVLFGGPTGLTSKAVREVAKRICSAIDSIGGDYRKQIKSLWKRTFPILKSEAVVLQVQETRNRISNNNIDLFVGEGKIVSSYNDGCIVRVCRPTECIEIKSKYVCIATGSRPAMPNTFTTQPPVYDGKEPNSLNITEIPLNFTNSKCIVTSTELGNLMEIPNAIAILGGGIIAVEYATVLSKLGVGVSLLVKDENFLPFLDEELREVLKRRMRRNHVLFVPETIKNFEYDPSGSDSYVKISLYPKENPVVVSSDEQDTSLVSLTDAVSYVKALFFPPEKPAKENTVKLKISQLERKLKVDMVLFSTGRNANSQDLGLENIGVGIGKYERIQVDQEFLAVSSTISKHGVHAIGDVIGGGLASTAQKQARVVSEKLFAIRNKETPKVINSEEENLDDDYTGFETESDSFFSKDTSGVSNKEANLFGKDEGAQSPLTLWTIPEIASVGISLSKLSDSDKYVEGRGYFKDSARGRLTGDMDGFLKIVVDSQSQVIVGVHIFGEGANELIQLGSVLVNSKATVQQVSNTPFAAVTLCGLYQAASDDAGQKLKLKLATKPE